MAKPDLKDAHDKQLAQAEGPRTMSESDIRKSEPPRAGRLVPVLSLMAQSYCASTPRTVLGDVDDELFKFVFRLFDPNGTGTAPFPASRTPRVECLPTLTCAAAR